jgi:hypothetical protein
VEVKIGVQHAPREIVIESNESQEDVRRQVVTAIENGGALELTDARGRTVVVPADRIAYVEVGSGVVGQVGFR